MTWVPGLSLAETPRPRGWWRRLIALTGCSRDTDANGIEAKRPSVQWMQKQPLSIINHVRVDAQELVRSRVVVAPN